MERYISIRMVNIDHYLDEPGPMDRAFCPFSNTPLNKVPVIRVFGSTPSGQKVCLHIHQAYPYFYVPYALPRHNVDPEQIQRDIFQFGNALNHALSLAQGRNQGVNGDQYIAAITLVKGVPFYGYHAKPESYLKIHLLNPADKQRMADLLNKGAVYDQRYQPHEAHIPYELQFMMDYNIYGMNWLHLHPVMNNTTHQQQRSADDHEEDNVQLSLRFREPLFDDPKTVLLSQTTSSSHGQDASIYLNKNEYFTSMTVPAELKWNRVGRSSYCELEIDTTVMTIGNRLELQQRDIHWNPKLEATYREKEKKEGGLQEKLIKSLAGIWKDEEIRRTTRNESMPTTQQDGGTRDYDEQKRQEWSSEEAWRRLIDKYMDTDKKPRSDEGENSHPSSLDTEEEEELIYSSNIPTTFEAVESLYPIEYYTLHQRPGLSQSLIIPPRMLSNLSEWLQQSSDTHHYQGSQPISELGTQERQQLLNMANDSPYSVQAATPSRYQRWQNEGKAEEHVNEDRINTLLRQQSSFFDDDIPDDDILALARQLSDQGQSQQERGGQEEHEQQQQEDFHDDDFMWPSDSPFRKTPERKRLPTIQISYEELEGEEEEEQEQRPDLFKF
ncbi:hypothetical protein BDA99DRAFT_170705 [Phascolomyces articulosus]|uniref:Uncharacterized protein n=1 Tax=Phascolomyces articulosus TaxID=60185 RepID=A0AAD5PAJ8_9FUNG|nr:hypothetical protein BDA99DRAFT_170705 [Phascolomyces articulosus]